MLRWTIGFALLGVIGLVAWQELRYLRARRDRAHDLQPILHSGRVFHVVTFLSLAGDDGALFAALRELRRASEASGDGRVVYAGKVAVNALASKQLVARFGGEVPWSAVLLAQFDSRAAAESVLASEGYRRALALFGRSYACGMQRSAWISLGLPIVLLGKRIAQIVSLAPSHFPFVAAEPNPEIEARAAQLLAAREYGARAVVVVNLLQQGTPENAAADARYTAEMFGMMAEGAHGPLHVGDAVPLEAGDRFDRVALVYYPGVQFFADMMRSRFYRDIVGDKQLADTQASITVPVLDRL